jgi:hypothetical protein
MEEEQRRRAEVSRQQEAVLKEKLRERTMVDKIEEEFSLRQREGLEEKKRRLAEIRMLHRPIDRKELEEFAEKVDRLQREKAAAKTAQSSQQAHSQVFYKSVFYRRVQKEQRLFEDARNEDELGRLREARDKLKKFSEHVKTAYRPALDEKLVEEMKFRSASLSKRGRSTSHPAAETPHKIGLRYLEFSKLQIDHQKLLVSGGTE